MLVNENKAIDGLHEVIIKGIVKDRKQVYVNLLALAPLCNIKQTKTMITLEVIHGDTK